MTFQRTTKLYAYEESLNIYAGTSASGTPVYSESGSNLANNKVYDPTSHCLAFGTYFAQMGDSYGDGWSTGSVLSIKQGGEQIALIQWSCGGSASNKVYSCSQFFTIEAPPEWQYSATAQTSSSWTTGELDWTSYTGNFPAPTTTTRYFRRSIQMIGTDNFGIRVTLNINGGAVMYVNGQELTRWNLPTGSISSTTQATVSTTGQHSYVQLLAALPTPVNDTYLVAVEVHAGSTTPSSEAFQCSVSFLSDDYRLIDSDGSYTCVPENYNKPYENGAKLYDGSVYTK